MRLMDGSRVLMIRKMQGGRVVHKSIGARLNQRLSICRLVVWFAHSLNPVSNMQLIQDPKNKRGRGLGFWKLIT